MQQNSANKKVSHLCLPDQHSHSSSHMCRYMNVFPSYVQSEDKDNGFIAGSCVTTNINPLLSCSGSHQGYLRLCPCREYRKGQVALPIEL